MSHRLHVSVILLSFLCMAQVTGPGQTRRVRPHARVLDFSAQPRDWAQFDFDVRHSGSNTEEAALGPDDVATLQIIFQKRLPGVTEGAPVLWANNSKRRAAHYLFFTATNGTLIATDGEGELRWQSVAPAGPRWTPRS